MTPPVVDLRSDTVTRPSVQMRAVMAEAPVGDDVYGEDPSVRALEEHVAELLGHEAGLFTPTGSMANQLALRLLVPPGQELLCDAAAHVVRAELGAAAALSGITTRTWSAPRGKLDVDAVVELAHPDAGPYLVSTAAVSVENTHNFGGGTVQDIDELRRLRSFADDAGLCLHLDGARLWNAHIASGVPLRAYGSLFDTVMVAFSKGLGAPAGSVLVSSGDRIAEARAWRKRLGGGMRQVGILAAGARHGLEVNLDRLRDDHARARLLAGAIAAAAPGATDPATVETNIVPVDLTGASISDAEFARSAADQGVLVSVLRPRRARLVTHLDVDDEGAQRAAEVLAKLVAG